MKVRLGDVCDFYSGTGFPNEFQGKKNGEFPFYKVGDISKNVLSGHQNLIYCENYIDSNVVNKIKGTIIPADTVVFAKIGEALKLNRRAITTCDCLIDNNTIGIKARTSKIRNLYFYYFMCNLDIQKLAESTTVPSVRKTKLMNVEIILPDINEQESIERLLNKITKLIYYRKQQLKKLDELVKSRFIEMFGEPLKNNKKWKTKKLKLIAPANEFTGDIEANGKMYWLLQLDMIESNTGKVLNKNLVTLDEIGASTIKFSSDNVLYSKLRPYLNKVVLPDEPGFATSEIIPLLPNEELNKIFLAFLLRDNGIVRFLNAHVSGSKMPRVQADIFWNLDIILPTITLQNQFADFVKQTDKSKLEIQKSLDKLEILKKSLMQKYFG